jgi:hypothetical protein
MKTICYPYVYSILSYGINFWGNSHLSESIFKIQKRIIGVITSSGRYDSCQDLFKKNTDTAISASLYCLIICLCH